MLRRLIALAIIVLIVLAWEGTVRLFEVKQYLLPAPSDVFMELWEFKASLVVDTLYTAWESFLGFGIALFFAFWFALFFANSRLFYESTMPLLISLKAVPIIAMAPLLILWLGNGVLSKSVMSALICFFPIVVNLTKGLNTVPEEHLKLMKSLSASRLQIFIKIRLPNSMPYLFSALKVASTLSVVGAIVAEFSGANKGIGYVILVAALRIETPMLFCGIFLASALGVLFYYAIETIESRVVFWEKTE